jgi:hypothetical protein
MTQEQEIKAKALEIAAVLCGHNFPVLFQSKEGQLKIHGGFDRIVKGVKRYLDGEEPVVFEMDQDELDAVISRFVDSKD